MVVLCGEREKFVEKKLLGETADTGARKRRIGFVSRRADDSVQVVCGLCVVEVVIATGLAKKKRMKPTSVYSYIRLVERG